MDFLRCQDFIIQAEDWLKNRVSKYSAKSLFLPAGETPKPLYAKWRSKPPAFLKDMKLLQVDDVIEGPKAHLFAKFFAEELPGYNVEPPIKEGKADLAILGLGTNGHVAFHEPGIPSSFTFGEVSLHADTAARLSLPTGTKARTYGVGAFYQAKAILLIVRGENKREAFERLLKEDPSIPASGLARHPDLTILTDLELKA